MASFILWVSVLIYNNINNLYKYKLIIILHQR